MATEKYVVFFVVSAALYMVPCHFKFQENQRKSKECKQNYTSLIRKASNTLLIKFSRELSCLKLCFGKPAAFSCCCELPVTGTFLYLDIPAGLYLLKQLHMGKAKKKKIVLKKRFKKEKGSESAVDQTNWQRESFYVLTNVKVSEPLIRIYLMVTHCKWKIFLNFRR